jgi:hypothetical protein
MRVGANPALAFDQKDERTVADKQVPPLSLGEVIKCDQCRGNRKEDADV